MNKRSVGSIYEQLAAEQLINMGYSVLACNYRNRFGEIDIIAKDGDTICFCEVKYRRDNGCGRALEAFKLFTGEDMPTDEVYELFFK